MARLDDMVLRNLRVMAATGLLDGSAAEDRRRGATPLMAPAAYWRLRARSRNQGSCCSKNERQALPLDLSKIKSIAVIGYNANAKFAHDGNSAQIKTSYEVTPLEGITKRAGDGVKVTYMPGFAAPNGRGAGRGRGRGAATAAATQGRGQCADRARRWRPRKTRMWRSWSPDFIAVRTRKGRTGGI